MHPRNILWSACAVGVCFGLMAMSWLLGAEEPPWWTARGVKSSAPAQDYAAVNQGQLKHMATAAYLEMEATLPGGSGTAVTALIGKWSQPDASGTGRVVISGSKTQDYAAVNLGQLKTVAVPFLDRLLALGYRGHPLETGTYPWVGSLTPPNDYAMANIGQVKNLFSFDLAAFAATLTPPGEESSDFTVELLPDGSIHFFWSGPGGGFSVTSYTIYQSDAEGNKTPLQTFLGGTLDLNLPINCNSLDGFSVEATNAAGATASSGTKSAEPLKPTLIPYAVIPLGKDVIGVCLNNKGHVAANLQITVGTTTKTAPVLWTGTAAPISINSDGFVTGINDSDLVVGGCTYTYHLGTDYVADGTPAGTLILTTCSGFVWSPEGVLKPLLGKINGMVRAGMDVPKGNSWVTDSYAVNMWPLSPMGIDNKGVFFSWFIDCTYCPSIAAAGKTATCNVPQGGNWDFIGNTEDNSGGWFFTSSDDICIYGDARKNEVRNIAIQGFGYSPSGSICYYNRCRVTKNGKYGLMIVGNRNGFGRNDRTLVCNQKGVLYDSLVYPYDEDDGDPIEYPWLNWVNNNGLAVGFWGDMYYEPRYPVIVDVNSGKITDIPEDITTYPIAIDDNNRILINRSGTLMFIDTTRDKDKDPLRTQIVDCKEALEALGCADGTALRFTDLSDTSGLILAQVTSTDSTTSISSTFSALLLPVKIKIMKQETETDDDWASEKFELPWDEIVNFDQPDEDDLLFKVTVPMQISDDLLKYFNVEIAIHGADNDTTKPTWVKYNLADIGKVVKSGSDIRCVVSNADVLQKIKQSADAGKVKCVSLDWVEDPSSSSYQDSDNFDAGCTNAPYLQLVNARGDGNPSSKPITDSGGTVKPWIAVANTEYVKGGGCMYVDIRLATTDTNNFNPETGARGLCRNEANCLYLSVHGMHSQAEHYGQIFPGGVLILPYEDYISPEELEWDSKLQCVIIAGCSVLDINDYNNNYPNSNAPSPSSHTDSPGKRWEAKSSATLLGYNYTAPGDKQAGAAIASMWWAQGGYSNAIAAWKIANEQYKQWNACAISGGVYYYWSYKKGWNPFSSKGWSIVSKNWISVPKSQW